jgi:LemA protein
MDKPEKRIREDIAPEVFELASRYYAEETGSYSNSELIEAGGEAGIPSKYIEQAIRDLQTQRQQAIEQQKQAQKQRQLLFKISAGILAAIAIWSIWTYNSLSSSASQVEAAWAQVENQLQRRADLIPNLISVTQAYAKQEQELISLLVQSRQAYLAATTPETKAAAIVQVDRAIERFGDYAAVNPQLKSSQLFVNLQYELAGTENRIAVERMRYNQAVQAYNQKIQQFPNSLIANVAGFDKQPFFQATNTDVPKI